MQNFNPITPSLRHMCLYEKKYLYKKKSFKWLVIPIKRNIGFNSLGRKTSFKKKLYHRRKLKLIDNFEPSYNSIPFLIKRFEYDANRNTSLALILYSHGLYKYIINYNKINLYSIKNIASSMYLKNTRIGSIICFIKNNLKNIIYIKASGTKGQVMQRKKNYILLLLPSKTRKMIHSNWFVNIDFVCSYGDTNYLNLGKSGKSIYKGIRPTVRGVAMNPYDHPHGGGEGKKSKSSFPRTP